MENAYAHAIVTLIDSGHTPEEAVRRVKDALERSGRLSLFPRIARAVTRLAERAHAGKPRLYVASETGKHAAQKEAEAVVSVTGVPVSVDETLIGGWRYLEKGRLIDTSYKQQLLDIYHRATR